MADFIKETAGNGIEIIYVPADRFKTNEISLSCYVPLSAQTAADNAAAALLLARNSREYPTILSLNRRLASLYGAQIEPSVSKLGDVQQLKIGMTCLDDRFSLDGEKITVQCVKLLLSLVFDPALDENGDFLVENVEREKRVLTEKIESEENEKRLYALRRAEEIMFDGDSYAVNKYGSKESAAALTSRSASQAWRAMLKSAKLVLTVVGGADINEIKLLFKERISHIERDYGGLPEPVIKKAPAEVKTVTERQKIKQGKLVMGFCADSDPNDPARAAAMRSLCDIFGGGPYSKLFANVREKMSLCYYCSARFTRRKSFIMVQSGCEEENMEKAQAEILNQLEEIKKGNFDYEFSASAAAVSDALDSVYDAPESIEGWYGMQSADREYISPSESKALNSAVTKEQIISCAESLRLDTVYKLSCEKEDF